MHNITFNERCTAWCRYVDRNSLFVQRQIDYLKEKFNFKGYMYLNDIYEAFGAAWNPNFDNICYRAKTGFDISFKHIEDADFMITIHD